MLYYIAHAHCGDTANVRKAKEKVASLQVNDLDNTYLCPLLMFSPLRYKHIGYEAEMELCLDLLSACDVLIVASKVTKGVRREIEFANLIGMEVLRLEEDGTLRLFEE